MKHWKPRAAAIVILTAALLTGTFTALNSDIEAPAAALFGEGGAVTTTLNRWIAVLSGGVPAEKGESSVGSSDESPDESPEESRDDSEDKPEDEGWDESPDEEPSEGFDDADGPGGDVASDWTDVQPEEYNDPPGSRPVQIRIGSDSGVAAPVETPLANVAPNQRIEKDFHVDNQGTQDAYVFLSVTLPYVAIATQKSDGTYVPSSPQPLYTFQANDGWTLLENSIDGGRITYVYAYASGLSAGGMTSLMPGASTPSLFNELITANYVEGKLDGTQEEVVARAYAIQTRELGDATTPAAIWQLIRNSAH